MDHGAILSTILICLLVTPALAEANDHAASPAGPSIEHGPGHAACASPAPGRAPPSSGDWTVNGTESCSSIAVDLRGNLTVQAGGSLTLADVKLAIAPGFDGQYHIEVQSGGALALLDGDQNPFTPDDGTFVTSSTQFHYLFWVRSGGALTVSNSLVKNCGYSMDQRGETAGLYLQSSDCHMTNTTFTDDWNGVVVDGCAPLISYDSFNQNRNFGMYVSDSNIGLWDNTFDGNAVDGLRIISSDITFIGNVVRGNLVNGLSAVGSTLRFENNIFQLNKWRAVDADSSPVTSTGDEFILNQVAFFINDTTLNVSSAIMQDNGYCVYGQDARANVSNTTMINSTLFDFYLTRYSDHSELTAHNTSSYNSTMYRFGTFKVSFGDPESALFVNWMVRAQVLWKSTGGPVPRALVKIFDARMQLLFNLTADDGGAVPPLELAQYEQTRSGATQFNPYRFGSFFGRYFNSSYITVDSDLDLWLFLDDVPPRFILQSPRDNITVSRSSVNVTGNMSDEFDASLTVNGVPVPIDPSTGNFSVTVRLEEGPNRINVTAVDMVGNVFTVVRTVNRDTTPPDLTVDLPAEGLLINRTSHTVTGRTEPRAYVLVNGVPALVGDDGTFEAALELSEGDNPVCVFSADQYRNGVWVNRTIVVDSVPPPMEMLSPGNGSWTSRPVVQVSGMTEEGASVLFNSTPLELARGNFSFPLRLVEGENLLLFTAVDRAGNRNSTTLLVHLDTVPPAVNITFPPDGSSVNYTPVRITGRTEPGALVACSDGNVTVDGAGGFSITCPLAIGPNNIAFEVRDMAGNIARVSVLVVLDTVVSFTLRSPQNGTRTTAASVTVEGAVEPGAALTIDGNSVTVGPDGSFSAKAALGMGLNIFVINVTDAAGNNATFYLLVRRDPVPGVDPMLLAGAALALALSAAGAWAWSVYRRRPRPAARSSPVPAGPVFLDDGRLVIKPLEAPGGGPTLRCALCLQPVEEDWVVCHGCGGPTSLAEIAPRTRERLASTDFPGGREKRLKAALEKGFADAALLAGSGLDVVAQMRELTIASQLLLTGKDLDAAERKAAQLERDIGKRSADLTAGRERELQKARAEARGQMTEMLSEAERVLADVRGTEADVRELERAINMARLQLRADNLERAYEHTLEARRMAKRLALSGGRP